MVESSGCAPDALQSILYERGSLRLFGQARPPRIPALYSALALWSSKYPVSRSNSPPFCVVCIWFLTEKASSRDCLSEYQGFQRRMAYIDAAEAMLNDDVTANKAIGFHGAGFLKQQMEGSERVYVLTHCNTGSFASAGYGTALGVIRAPHAGGALEKAFCTETRPFNQGSRLTAFELVHDRIPATLIADSSVAALMKTGCVHAVVVGADCIAANGDTANKIGTYSIALCAKHHGVRFYVAAPTASIDLSVSSGQEIIIEERSPKELLNSDGGLGKQAAASGITVWNPAFDVTPVNMITAIITEKGVITKTGADAFDIKVFIQNTHQAKNRNRRRG